MDERMGTSRERFRELRSCRTKIAYPSYLAALQAASRIGDETMQLYGCEFCALHHLGHLKVRSKEIKYAKELKKRLTDYEFLTKAPEHIVALARSRLKALE